jgi:cytochrome c-type biogenesis protein CcmE
MKAHRKQKLILILLGISAVAVAAALIGFAFQQNINLFYSPTDIANGGAPKNVQIRAGGMVKVGSINRATDRLYVEFISTDYTGEILMKYEGALPDLFAEGQGVVATGILNEKNEFIASTILAKHDEEYMPPEVASALERANHKPVNSDTNAYQGER